MKKSTKKVISRLKPLIGKEIIRIKPTNSGDFSYTDSPLVLLGFTVKGELIIRNEKRRDTKFYEKTLPIQFTDAFWISYKRSRRAKNNSLNKWRGQYVRRIVPIEDPFKDISFMNPADHYRLISVSKHHVFLERSDGSMAIQNCLYANPAEWELNE